jgi:hypothetical protein
MTILTLEPKEDLIDLKKNAEVVNPDDANGIDSEQIDDTTLEDLKVPRVFWNDLFK